MTIMIYKCALLWVAYYATNIVCVMGLHYYAPCLYCTVLCILYESMNKWKRVNYSAMTNWELATVMSWDGMGLHMLCSCVMLCCVVCVCVSVCVICMYCVARSHPWEEYASAGEAARGR